MMFLGFLVLMPCALHAKDEVLRAAPTARISGLSKQTLRLLGEGTFRYLGIKLYTASFYLDPQVREPHQALSDAPKRLVIRYLRDIPKKALIEAAEKNLRNNPSADLNAIKERVDHLHERYSDLKKGDVYELAYSKGRTFLYHNGSLRAQIEGADFASAYFGIWLSEYSISQKLRKDLLGVQR
jgi:Chalcone isomerase-like